MNELYDSEIKIYPGDVTEYYWSTTTIRGTNRQTTPKEKVAKSKRKKKNKQARKNRKKNRRK